MHNKISDSDVKNHLRPLKRMCIFLVLALIGTSATLHSRGVFSEHPLVAASSSPSVQAEVSHDMADDDAKISTLRAKPSEPDVVVESTQDSETRPVKNLDNVDETVDSISASSDAETLDDSHKNRIVVRSSDEADSESHTLNGNATPSSRLDTAGDMVEVQSLSLIYDYGSWRSRFRINGKHIAETAKRLASLAPESEFSGLETITLETAESATTLTTSADQVSRHDPTAIVIHNVESNRGSVAFLADRDLKNLDPGESITLFNSVVVRFHRGGEFGNAKSTLTPGVYEFRATARGWYLEDVDE